MKEYPLQVETLMDCDTGERVSYYSKGHHDPAAFVEAVLEHQGAVIRAENVKHEHRRWHVMAWEDEWVRSLDPPRPGTTRRGVFPVTIIEW